MSKIVLRDYQLEGVEFLHKGKRKGLGDAPGLGKSVQASEAVEFPVLISCPTYLTDQWYDFLTEQYPNRKTMVAQNSRSDKEFVLKMPADFKIVNHEMFRVTVRKNEAGKVETYSKYDMPTDINTLIIDESHHFRGRKSSQAERMLLYSREIERVYQLSATPIYKAADDLYMQLRILDYKTWRSYHDFVQRFMVVNYRAGFSNRQLGIRKGSPLRAIMDYYWLIRSYQDVGRQLPPEIPKLIRVPMSESTRKTYRNIKEYYRTEDDVPIMTAMEQMHHLRRLTLCPEKLDAMKHHLEDSDTPNVIFCQYRDSAQAVSKATGAVLINGDMPPEQRKRVAQTTTNNHIVATIDSMSEGVNLTHFKAVLFMEQDWAPGSRYQCVSRVIRDRNNDEYTDPVVVATINMINTIDEQIHKAVQERRSDAREILRRSLI